MQLLIVLAVVSGTFADSNLLINPYGAMPWTTYGNGLVYPIATGMPLTYIQPTLKPIATEIKPKKVEVELKRIELVPEKTGCKNGFGDDVPCARSKRDADTNADADSLLYINSPYVTPYAAGIYGTPFTTTAAMYNAPITTSSLVYRNIINTPALVRSAPLIATSPCKNDMGMAVPCRVKRDADANSDSLLYLNPVGFYSAPLTTSPLLRTLATPTVYTTNVAPEKRVIEVPQPVFKTVVEQVPVEPLCRNDFGMKVPCA